MPPEYITKGEYKELVEKYERLKEKYEGDLFKLRKQIQEQRARDEEREKLKDRLWTERIVYITIIIAAITLIVTMMM